LNKFYFSNKEILEKISNNLTPKSINLINNIYDSLERNNTQNFTEKISDLSSDKLIKFKKILFINYCYIK